MASKEKDEKNDPCFITDIEAERFFSYVQKIPGGCWEWIGGKMKKGLPYGKFNLPGHPGLLAHRVSWWLHTDIAPHGMCVLHSCDNPPCVNPDHLTLGTQAENNQDKARKGRAAQKLSPENVIEIKGLIGVIPSKDIAARFGISQSGISKIKNGKNWGSFK